MTMAAVVSGCVSDDDPADEVAQGATSFPGTPFPMSMAPNAPLVQGVRATYTITALNDTADTANVGVVMDFGFQSFQINVTPTGCVKLGGNSAILLCPAAPLAPGATLTFNPQVTPIVAGPVNQGAGDSTTDSTGVTQSQSGVDLQVNIAPGPTDLQVTGSSNQGAPLVGTMFTETFQVKNNGPFATSDGVSFSDALPPGLTFSTVSTDIGACTGGATVSCALGSLAVGQQATIRIVATANTAAQIVNTATANLPVEQTDRQPANNSVSVTVTSR